MNSLWTVMMFTMKNKLRGKAFIVMTLVLAALLVVVGNLPNLLSKLESNEPSKVGYVQGVSEEVVQGLQIYFGAQEERQVEMIAGAAEADLKDSLEQGDLKGYLLFTDNEAAGFPDAVYYSESTFGSGTQTILGAGLRAVKNELIVSRLGLDEGQRQMLQSPVNLQSEKVSFTNEAGKTDEELATASTLVYALIFLLFMAVMITGQLIATEITAEKSSRVMEILVTSVSPLKQMFGKIFGTFAVSVIQLAILVGAFALNLMLPANKEALDGIGINLDSIDPLLFAYAIFFYLAGFFLYATMFAGIGSIVSRTEDLGQAVLPITMLTLVGFYIAIFGLQQPDHIFVAICSYIPFFSPFIMFMRIGLSEPGWWEIALSIGILLGSILFLGWLSAKIYRTGVLMYGKRPSVKELVRAMRAYKV